MALLFISLLGLICFFLFLRALSRVSSPLLVAVFQWTGFSLMAVAFVLFILSGRIFLATALVGCLVLIYWQHTQNKRKILLLPPKK